MYELRVGVVLLHAHTSQSDDGEMPTTCVFFCDPIQVSPKSRHVLSQVSSMPLTGICDPEVASNGRHCHRGGIVDRFMQSGEQTNEQARARAQSMTSLMVTTRIYV